MRFKALFLGVLITVMVICFTVAITQDIPAEISPYSITTSISEYAESDSVIGYEYFNTLSPPAAALQFQSHPVIGIDYYDGTISDSWNVPSMYYGTTLTRRMGEHYITLSLNGAVDSLTSVEVLDNIANYSVRWDGRNRNEIITVSMIPAKENIGPAHPLICYT